MIAEFCTWCREYVVNNNSDCKECETCLKCNYFDGDRCINETVVSEYKREWNRPPYILGIGPPLCRKYCPNLSDSEGRKAHILAEGEDANKSKNSDIEISSEESEDEKSNKILFTPLPKFWLSSDCECITFEVDFSETIYYHMVLLGGVSGKYPSI
jgi:hypothetical protein